MLNNVQCSGNENQLLTCVSSQILSISHNCGHDDDAGVICTGIIILCSSTELCNCMHLAYVLLL